MLLFHKLLQGMTNSVDPDQTAPSAVLKEHSDLGLHCLHMQFVKNVNVQNFRTFIFRSLYIFIYTPLKQKNLFSYFLLDSLMYYKSNKFPENFLSQKQLKENMFCFFKVTSAFK